MVLFFMFFLDFISKSGIMLNVRSNKMSEQNFEFVVNKNDEKIWKITKLGTFKDVVEAIIKMQAIANEEVSYLKKTRAQSKT